MTKTDADPIPSIVTPTLTICGLSEITSHGERAVSHVLSLLDPGTPDPQDFTRYPAHHRVTLRFDDAVEPGPGLILPTPEDVAAILDFGRAVVFAEAGELHLLVHCHMGISRSTAAMAMLLAQAEPERDADAVFDRIATIRPQAWPNSRMIGFADAQLGRRGRLLDALGRLYARRLRQAPDIATFMHANGRSGEIAMAEAASTAGAR